MVTAVIDPDAGDYEAGFQNSPEQATPVRMVIHGAIPKWITGHLYRCAPTSFKIDGLSPEATKRNGGKDSYTHRFTILEDGSVEYMSRKISKALEEKIQKTGEYGVTFANILISGGGDDNAINIGVTISPNFPLAGSQHENIDQPRKGPRTLVTKTDASVIQELDPVTLEPVRTMKYSAINPDIVGNLSAAHGHFDASTREYINFALQFGRTTSFRPFILSEENPTGEVLTVLPDVRPSYMHSFALTDRYIIYPFWPYTVDAFSFLWNQSFLAGSRFDASRHTLLVVIDRSTKQHVATYRAPAAFGFHVINAWEENDDIVFDVPTHPDNSLVFNMFVDEGILAQTQWPLLHRYRLPAVSEMIESYPVMAQAGMLNAPTEVQAKIMPESIVTKLSTVGIELPRIHPTSHRKRYQYAYGMSSSRTNPTLHPVWEEKQPKMFDAIVKMNVSTTPSSSEHNVPHLMWFEKHCYPGEPVFLPRPGGVEEDDGVLVSVVLRGREWKEEGVNSTFLLFLDAKDLTEVARAEMPAPHVVPFGFHGNFYSFEAPIEPAEQ
ncbi:hypothetical protein HDU67_003779 [Dinochytrium kinnereticum]|nr:hypothetical protein HDU67_003779 [Dinochytrium kinnereticum]